MTLRPLMAGISLGGILVSAAYAQQPQQLPCENVLGSITTNLVNAQRESAGKDQEIARLRAENAKLQAALPNPPDAPAAAPK